MGVMSQLNSSRPMTIMQMTPADAIIRRRSIPFWRWTRDALGTAGFRFAVLFVIVFGVSVGVLAASIWEQTEITITGELKSAIASDAVVLSARYGESGLLAASKAVQQLSNRTSTRSGLYLLVDHENDIVAGNLSRWPSGVTDPHVWYRKRISFSSRKIDGLLRVYDLPEGFRLLVGRNTDRDNRILKMLQTEFLSVAGEVFLLAIIGGAMMRALLNRALADLNGVAVAISRGDLSARIRQTRRGRELNLIAGTINEILDRTAFLLDGVRNVTSAISHDLRTPITRVRMRLEDATALAADRPDLIESLSNASADLDRITSIFEALLRIAEIESGARRSAFRKFDLTPHLLNIVELYQTYADNSGIVLTISRIPTLPMFGDPDMIQQALVNLLDNALKFSPQGGTIYVEALMEGNFLAITIADEGAGIAENDRSRVGERFFRTETARSTPGSGLGLSLVVSVCQLHGGVLVLDDNNPGLRATIRLNRGEG